MIEPKHPIIQATITINKKLPYLYEQIMPVKIANAIVKAINIGIAYWALYCFPKMITASNTSIININMITVAV